MDCRVESVLSAAMPPKTLPRQRDHFEAISLGEPVGKMFRAISKNLAKPHRHRRLPEIWGLVFGKLGAYVTSMSTHVSVIMAAFNVSQFIPRAIASVQAQSWTDWRLIVVDDGSTDGTDRVVAAFTRSDARISLIRHERNKGQSTARNTALDAADGEWIAVLDSDDAWRPERLQEMLAVGRELDVEFIADNLIFYDEAVQQEGGVAFSIPNSPRPIFAKDLFSSGFGNSGLSFGLLKPLVRVDKVREFGARYAQSLRYGEDLHFYAQLLINRVRAVLLAEPYYLYTAPFGPKSGQRARGSQTDRATEDRWSGCLWLYDDLVSRYGQMIAPDLRSEMSIWRGRMERMWVQGRLIRLLRERKFGGWLSLAARYPLHAAGLVTPERVARATARRFG